MNRSITALFAALEALLVVGIGVGIPLVPLSLLWAFQYGLQVDWTVFWRASADIWLVGHGADLHLTLDPITATIAGLPGASTPFVISIAALGFALLTALLAVRAGRRIAETPHHILGVTVAAAVFGALSFGVSLSAVNTFARPSIVQGALWPTIVFVVGLGIGALLARRRIATMPGNRHRVWRVHEWWGSLSGRPRVVILASLRGGLATAAGVIAVSAILLAVLIAVNYGQLVALYERIHAGAIGGIAVTLGQAAFLPNAVVWVASWLLGPGFAVGTGSSVSPLGTSLGPIPTVPILGVLPAGDLALGFLGLVVPVVVAFVVAVAIRPAVLRKFDDGGDWMALLAVGCGIGLVGGLTMGILAWLSGGAAGPGRLANVGPDALLVGLFAALEFGIPAILGLLVGRRSHSK